MDEFFCHFLQEYIVPAHKGLLYLALKLDRARIRLVGVSLENLSEGTGSPQQLLLGEREKGWREATEAIDAATRRFGQGSVRPARLMENSEAGDSSE